MQVYAQTTLTLRVATDNSHLYDNQGQPDQTEDPERRREALELHDQQRVGPVIIENSRGCLVLIYLLPFARRQQQDSGRPPSTNRMHTLPRGRAAVSVFLRKLPLSGVDLYTPVPISPRSVVPPARRLDPHRGILRQRIIVVWFFGPRPSSLS